MRLDWTEGGNGMLWDVCAAFFGVCVTLSVGSSVQVLGDLLEEGRHWRDVGSFFSVLFEAAR